MEKEKATHSHILAGKIQWTGEPGGLQSIGLQRAGHDWETECMAQPGGSGRNAGDCWKRRRGRGPNNSKNKASLHLIHIHSSWHQPGHHNWFQCVCGVGKTEMWEKASWWSYGMPGRDCAKGRCPSLPQAESIWRVNLMLARPLQLSWGHFVRQVLPSFIWNERYQYCPRSC